MIINNNKKSVPDYDAYLKSERWQRLRSFKLKKAEYQCQMCGENRVKLEVHHNSYKNIGCEAEKDLIVLCSDCHGWHHIDKEDKIVILAALKQRELGEYIELDERRQAITFCNNSRCVLKSGCYRYSDEVKGTRFEPFFDGVTRCDKKLTYDQYYKSKNKFK